MEISTTYTFKFPDINGRSYAFTIIAMTREEAIELLKQDLFEISQEVGTV